MPCECSANFPARIFARMFAKIPCRCHPTSARLPLGNNRWYPQQSGPVNVSSSEPCLRQICGAPEVGCSFPRQATSCFSKDQDLSADEFQTKITSGGSTSCQAPFPIATSDISFRYLAVHFHTLILLQRFGRDKYAQACKPETCSIATELLHPDSHALEFSRALVISSWTSPCLSITFTSLSLRLSMRLGSFYAHQVQHFSMYLSG